MTIERLYEDIINSLEDGVYFVDTQRRITLWNRAAERITGYESREILGHHCQDNRLDHIDMEGRPLCLVGCPLFETLGDGELRIDEVLLRHKDGHRIAVLVKILPIYGDDGKIVGAVEIFTPRTQIATDSHLVDSLTDRVMTDALTGLPNRVFMESFLDYKIKEYQRFGNWYGVLFMDIDNFRNFNNHYGHHVGDKVLVSIANSMQNNLRRTDAFGRWGGEEFLGVFSIRNNQEACIVAEKIRLLVSGSEILHQGERIKVTCSVGMACGRPSDTLDSVVERADQMMYLSKERTKNCITVENAKNRDSVFVDLNGTQTALVCPVENTAGN